MSFSVFGSTFVLIFLAELVDKSRLAGLVLAGTFRSRASVFWGMTAGYFLLDGIAVLAGGMMGSLIPEIWINRVAGSLFIIFGVAAWIWGDKAQAEGQKWIEKYRQWGPFWVSFLTISLTELGDRTQIAAGGLAAETRAPLSVFSGALAALIILNFLTVWLGGQLASRLPTRLIHRGAGALFVLVGFWMLIWI